MITIIRMQAPTGALGQNKKFWAWRQAVSKPKLFVLSRPNAPLGAFMHMMPRLQRATNLNSWISLPRTCGRSLQTSPRLPLSDEGSWVVG